jgi:hypothetical protein
MSRLSNITLASALLVSSISPRVAVSQDLRQTNVPLRVDLCETQAGYKLGTEIPQTIRGIKAEGNRDINVHNGSRSVIVEFDGGDKLLVYQWDPCARPYRYPKAADLNYAHLAVSKDGKTGSATAVTTQENDCITTNNSALVEEVLGNIKAQNDSNNGCFP